MINRKVFVLSCTTVFTIAAFVGKKTIDSRAYQKDGLLVANVEALTQEESNPQKCTIAIIYGSCYDSHNLWKGTYIDKVDDYVVYPGSPRKCFHDRVTPCPHGTHR